MNRRSILSAIGLAPLAAILAPRAEATPAGEARPVPTTSRLKMIEIGDYEYAPLVRFRIERASEHPDVMLAPGMGPDAPVFVEYEEDPLTGIPKIRHKMWHRR